jgi:uncharacterized protein
MKLEQSFDVAAPLERVWNALIDVEQVAPCLPGAAVTGRNEDGTYNGTFTIKIGPTTASYAGKLEMEDIDEAGHRATMQANGTDKRGQGGAKATIVSWLSEAGGGGTRVRVATDYQITGRLARFGRGGMIEDISERLLREFAARLQESLGRDPGMGEASQTAEQAPPAVEEARAAAEEPQEEDRWETVNVAALTRDGAQAREEPALVADEPPPVHETPPQPAEAAPALERAEALSGPSESPAPEPTEAAAAPETSEVPPEAIEEPPPPVAEAPPPPAPTDGPPEPPGPAEAPPPPLAEAPPPPEAPPQAPPRALQPPPQPVEPFDAGSAVGSVMWERLRSNAVLPFAFIAGLVLALILFRRRGRR